MIFKSKDPPGMDNKLAAKNQYLLPLLVSGVSYYFPTKVTRKWQTYVKMTAIPEETYACFPLPTNQARIINFKYFKQIVALIVMTFEL